VVAQELSLSDGPDDEERKKDLGLGRDEDEHHAVIRLDLDKLDHQVLGPWKDDLVYDLLVAARSQVSFREWDNLLD